MRRRITVKHYPSQPTVSNIYYIAFLLAQVIPRDVVPIVLDYAEFWHCFPLARTRRNIEINHRVGRQIYLMATIPRSLPRKAMRSLTIKILSSDLNKGLRTFNHGGENPYSFFELSVSVAASMVIDMEQDDDKRIRNSLPLKTINNQHLEAYTMYTRRYSVHDPDREARALVRSIGPGDRLALIMRVNREAYVNSAKFASMVCQVALVRKM